MDIINIASQAPIGKENFYKLKCLNYPQEKFEMGGSKRKQKFTYLNV